MFSSVKTMQNMDQRNILNWFGIYGYIHILHDIYDIIWYISSWYEFPVQVNKTVGMFHFSTGTYHYTTRVLVPLQHCSVRKCICRGSTMWHRCANYGQLTWRSRVARCLWMLHLKYFQTWLSVYFRCFVYIVFFFNFLYRMLIWLKF